MRLSTHYATEPNSRVIPPHLSNLASKQPQTYLVRKYFQCLLLNSLSSNFEKPKAAHTTPTRGGTRHDQRARLQSTNRVSSTPYTVSRASVLLLCGRLCVILSEIVSFVWLFYASLANLCATCLRSVLRSYDCRDQRNVVVGIVLVHIVLGTFSVAINCHQRRAVLAAKVLNASSESFASLSCAAGTPYTTPSVVCIVCVRA